MIVIVNQYFQTKFSILLILLMGIIGTGPAYSAEKTWSFDLPANYSYDTGNIEVKGGVAQLDRTADWSDSDWDHRKKITINSDSVAGTFTDFPLLIQLNDPDITKAQSDGEDFRFTNISGTTQLDHEIETYDDATGSLTAWVRIPELTDSVDTEIYLYYDNPSAVNQENTTAVWSSNFQMVQHMNDDPSDPSPQLIDSTLNDKNGTSGGAMTSSDRITGRLGDAITFDGNDDHVDITPSVISGGTEFTLSAWINIQGIGANSWNRYLDLQDGSNNNVFAHYWDSDSDFKWGFYENAVVSGSDPPQNEWHHWVGTYNQTTNDINFYFDGKLKESGTVSKSWSDPVLSIGKRFDANDEAYAIFDEVTLSTVERGAAWIETTYNNQNDTGRFYSIGPEVNYSNLPGEPFPDTSPRLTNKNGLPYKTLSTFTDTKPLEEGKITYQITNDTTSWYYHDGSNWGTASDSTQTNTPLEIDNNIESFSSEIGAGDFHFRAFFESNGTQQNKLDTVTVRTNELPTIQLLKPDTGQIISRDVPGTYVVTDPENEPGTITIEISEDSGATWDTKATISGETESVSMSDQGDTHSFSWDSIRDLGQVYDTRIRLRIRVSDGFNTSAYDTSGPLTLDNIPPDQPNLLTPEDGEETKAFPLLFAWSDVLDTGTGIKDYRIQVDTGPMIDRSDGLIFQGDTTTSDTLLSLDDETYSWRVFARDRAPNTSGYTSTDTFILDRTPPIRVTNLRSTATIEPPDTGVNLFWDYGSNDVKYFRIYRSFQTMDTSTAIRIDTVSIRPDTITYRDSTATRGDSFFYYVTAVDTAQNESDSSNITGATHVTFIKNQDDTESHRPGDTIVYTIKFSNDGFSPTNSLILEDAIPDSVTLADTATVVSGPAASIEYFNTNSSNWQTSSFPRESILKIRWIINDDLDPQKTGYQGTVRFRCRID